MQNRQHFEEFYTCPACGNALYRKQILLKQYKEGTTYCTRCALKIREDIEHALISIKKANTL